MFYETLLKQLPDSAMAQEWCVAYGVLSYKESKRLSEKVLNRKRQQRGLPAASPTKKAKKPKIIKEEGTEPDLQVSSGDGVGTMSL